jgi:hypothetical protein
MSNAFCVRLDTHLPVAELAGMVCELTGLPRAAHKCEEPGQRHEFWLPGVNVCVVVFRSNSGPEPYLGIHYSRVVSFDDYTFDEDEYYKGQAIAIDVAFKLLKIIDADMAFTHNDIPIYVRKGGRLVVNSEATDYPIPPSAEGLQYVKEPIPF